MPGVVTLCVHTDRGLSGALMHRECCPTGKGKPSWRQDVRKKVRNLRAHRSEDRCGCLDRWSIDELPQLWNIIRGDMSLVGPRPDVAGFADQLQGGDRVVLTIRPGITGPATIAFRNEEEILASVDNPEVYNREVIWPEKVAINKQYIQEQSLVGDIKLLWQTVVGTRML